MTMDTRNITPEALERFMAFTPEQLLAATESLSVTVNMNDLYMVGNWNFDPDYDYAVEREGFIGEYKDYRKATDVTLEFMSTGSFYKVGNNFDGEATGDDLGTLQDIQKLIRGGFVVYFNYWTTDEQCLMTQRLRDRLIETIGNDATINFLDTVNNSDELYEQLANNSIGMAMLNLQDGEVVTQVGNVVDLETIKY